MAECGVRTCRAIIPLGFQNHVQNVGVSFSGVAQEIRVNVVPVVPWFLIDSKTCPDCGVHFVMDDLITALSS